jgi:hypothetical protein
MLKKIVLVALFVASAAATTSTVFAHSAQTAPVPTAPQGFSCPAGKC